MCRFVNGRIWGRPSTPALRFGSDSRLGLFPLGALGLVLLGGCHSLGPHTIARDRLDYSSSISESWKRQAVIFKDLQNIARHARARTVEISLRVVDGGALLAVRDDGSGFDPARQRTRPSLGLSSMRERVLSLGGHLDLESAPEQGTTIVAWVPLPGAD